MSIGNCDEQWVPTTGSGNPKIGQFEHSTENSEGVNEVINYISKDALKEEYCFAAYVELNGPNGQETGWAEGTGFDGNNWAMYVEALLSDCVADLNIEGLVAYYPFNGNASDESGYENHGIINDATLTMDRYGNLNSAYKFDGIDDFIQISSASENILGSDDFTVLTWFRSTSTDEGAIWGKRNTSSCSQVFGPTTTFSQTSKINGNTFSARFRSTNNYTIYSENPVSDSNWHLATVVRAGNSLSLYIDPLLEESVSIAVGIDFSTTLDFFIGRTSYCSGNHFTGDIDDFSIYNRALTQLEIDFLYNE